MRMNELEAEIKDMQEQVKAAQAFVAHKKRAIRAAKKVMSAMYAYGRAQYAPRHEGIHMVERDRVVNE